MILLNTYRILDANLNRVSEGFRVLEDISRFIYNDMETTEKLRNLRHRTRKSFFNKELISNRDSVNDVGHVISISNTLDAKDSIDDLVIANFKRVQEGLRSIEECLKIIGNYMESKQYEDIRYSSYIIEKNFCRRNITLFDTELYGIIGEEFSKGRSNVEVVKEMVSAGVKIIQYREKTKSKLTKYKECTAIQKIIRNRDIAFIINDDVDIAVSVGATGVHLGQEDMPIEGVRRIVGDMLIGMSTHNSQQAQLAVEEGADYIGVGPIFPTTTKKNPEASDGLSYLKWVSENINIPYVAIGGIKETNILEVKNNGGKCFALISEIISAPSITEKINSIRKIINEDSQLENNNLFEGD